MSEPIDRLMEALRTRPQTIMVCYAKCWSCNFGEHDSAWHTWADADDVAHALSIGHADPSDQKCGCYCQAKAEKPDDPAPEQELADDYERNDHQ